MDEEPSDEARHALEQARKEMGRGEFMRHEKVAARYGGYIDLPVKWSSPPFNGDWPSSMCVSHDPVAIGSVCYGFMWIGWSGHPRIGGAAGYRAKGAPADAPLPGTFYDP